MTLRPSEHIQVLFGLATGAITLIVVGILAFAPDPLMRQKVYATTFDNVDAVLPGAPVYFQGAKVGELRTIRLQPEAKVFAVRMGVRKDWRPGPCAYARIEAPLPVTAPRVEIVSPDTPDCEAARAAAGCEALAAPTSGGAPLVGCRRQADVMATATATLTQLAELAAKANGMAGQIQKVIDGSGRPGEAAAARQLVADASATLATANRITARLDQSLAPGGDAAASLANLRKASGKAAEIDIDRLNATIAEVQAMVRKNEAAVSALLSEGAALSAESRALLQDVSGTLSSASANLERVSGNLDALAERVSDDPTFVVRGQRYTDPPPAGGPQ